MYNPPYEANSPYVNPTGTLRQPYVWGGLRVLILEGLPEGVPNGQKGDMPQTLRYPLWGTSFNKH